MNYEKLESKSIALKNYFKRIIEGVVADSNTQILEKNSLFRFLELPPVELSTFDGVPIFYKDREMGFQRFMTYGNDFSVSYHYNP